MARVMVSIDIDDISYEELRRVLIAEPDPEWFMSNDPTTHTVSIDEAHLVRDMDDDNFFVFRLIGVAP